jgi:hypothetical protein
MLVIVVVWPVVSGHNWNNTDRQCTYKRNIETRSPSQFYRGKGINFKYSEFVIVALLIQHTVLMHFVMLSSVARLSVPYFSALSI